MRSSAQVPRLPSHWRDLVPTSLLLFRRQGRCLGAQSPSCLPLIGPGRAGSALSCVGRQLSEAPRSPPGRAGTPHSLATITATPSSSAERVYPAPLRVSCPRHAGHYEHLRCSDTAEVLWACVLATLLRTQTAPE